MKVSELLKKIEQCKASLVRAQAREEAIKAEIAETTAELREALDCEPSEERDALQNLREEIAEDEAELTKLLDDVTWGPSDE